MPYETKQAKRVKTFTIKNSQLKAPGTILSPSYGRLWCATDGAYVLGAFI